MTIVRCRTASMILSLAVGLLSLSARIRRAIGVSAGFSDLGICLLSPGVGSSSRAAAACGFSDSKALLTAADSVKSPAHQQP